MSEADKKSMTEAEAAEALAETKATLARRKTVVLFSLAMLFLAIAPIFLFQNDPKPDPKGGEGDPAKEFENSREVEALSKDGSAARVAWGAYEVLHLRDRYANKRKNGFARGAAISEVWTEHLDHKKVYEALIKDMPKENTLWIEELFKKVLEDPSPLIRGGWLPDLVQETQGASHVYRGELQRLLLATQVSDMLKVDALAIDSEQLGPIIVAEISSPMGPPVGDWLTPIVYRIEEAKDKKSDSEAAQDELIFMLGAFGHSAPLLGMNLEGLSLIRLPMAYAKEHSVVSTGPDALTQTRVLLQSREKAGLEPDQIGPDLIALTETRMISRLSTPSALLAADPAQAWRYEWSSIGADPKKSGGLEFKQLTKEEPLPATSLFLSPEKRSKEGEDYVSPLAKDFEKTMTIEQLIEWVKNASGKSRRVPARVVMIPSLKRVLYFEGGDDYDNILNPMLDLELGRALGVDW